ncbi:MAG TPA: hypothetical protein VHF25_07590 [Nitriliruptorales bacterium]|nr:hypothetical protein [Nitriliruptorales bacterium]
MLPFDGPAGEAPVPYALTARARRLVAPDSLPDLAVVPPASRPATQPTPARPPGPLDDPTDRSDTRPARARASARAGRDPAQIAASLGVDRQLVAAWCGDVRPPRRTGRRRSGQGRDGRVAAVQPAAVTRPPDAARTAARTALQRRSEAGDPTVAALALVVGLADLTAHAVALTTDDAELAALATRTLLEQTGVPRRRLRVVLQAGAGVARDLAAHRWAARLDLRVEAVTAAPWPAAPHRDATRVSVRAADPVVAATVAGWRDALLTLR